MPAYRPVPIAYSSRTRPSPYFEATLDHGVGAFTVYNHMLLPMHFGDPEAEYHGLLASVSVWDVAGERQVEITGPDAAAFTQYLVTRDVTKVRPGRARYTLVCQDDGGVLNDPVMLRLAENHFWLSLADADILLWAKGVAHGSRYDVTIREPDVSPVQVQGPKSADLMRPLFGEIVDTLKFYQFVETDLEGVPVVVSRTGWSGEFGYEVFLRDGSRGAWLWERLFEAGEPFNVTPGAPNQIRRVEAGLLSYGTDMDASINPLELGLEKFVDLDGPDDFVGKAALREVASRGPARRRTGLFVDGDPIRLGPIRWWPVLAAGEVIGFVTSAVWSPGLEDNIAYALVAAEHAEPERSVVVRTPDGDRAATTTAIPFEEPRYRR